MAASEIDSQERASRDGEEIEVKLVARDAAVFDELAARTELAGYRLRAGGDHLIRDRYWDTPDWRLLERGTSFRLRSEDGTLKFTIKGPGTIKAGLSRHPELEVAADAAGWRAVRAALAEHGLDLPAGLSGPDPAAWLAAAGLEVKQDRRTRRRALLAARDGHAIAELALDQTVYHLGRYEVGFREIEVEALAGELEEVLALGGALRVLFGERVEPSEQSKYARGRDLARRLEA